jgi:hypothetical protein
MKWSVPLALVLMGCPPRAEQNPPAPVPATSPDSPVQATPTITAEKLDAWLRYHRVLAEQSKDAGTDIKRLSLLERDSRQRAGLSEAELELLEDCISAVVAQRTIAKLTGAEAVRDFDKVTVGLRAEQRQKVEAAFGDVRAKAQQAASLEAERAKFGEAVTVVLAREAEVTATWNALLDVREAKPK